MRYLAIDLGGKRTGLAVGDDVLRLPTPAGVIVTASPEVRMQQIMKTIDAHGPDVVLVGLPLNMDGSRGPAAEKAAAVAQQIADRARVEVELVDERMTSIAADDHMARTGMTHKQKKNRRDALAAAVILQDFFDRLDQQP